MKRSILLFAILSVVSCSLFAQRNISLKNFDNAPPFNRDVFNKDLGKIGTLCDTVKSIRIVSDTLTLLNMGGVYPHQKYTVMVRGNKITLDWTNIKGKVVCASGTFEIFNGQPQIMVAEPEYISLK
jgi:hypothetical protein